MSQRIFTRPTNRVAKKGKILIVDDEPNILIPLEFLIKEQGYQVVKASNGEEALQKAAAVSPDIIILDVMMPGIDGFEVARRLRQKSEFSTTSIIFLTAKGTQNDRFRGYESGGEIYLTKPFDNKELVDTINEVFEFG